MIFGEGVIHSETYLMTVGTGSHDIIHIHLMYRTVGQRVKRFFLRDSSVAIIRVRVKKICREFTSGVQKASTFCQRFVMMLIESCIEFSLKRRCLSCAGCQYQVNHWSAHLITCRSRIHHFCLFDPADRNRF